MRRPPTDLPARRTGLRPLAATLVCAAALVGCGDHPPPRPPALDGGLADLGARDLGDTVDLGGAGDAGAPDLGAGDAGPPPACDVPAIPALATEAVGDRFSAPIALTSAPGDEGAVYVAERAGRVRRVAGGVVTTFLDMRSAIGSAPGGEDERGLLGLAFAPDYATSGRFFVGYTPTTTGADANIVAEYRRSAADPLVADPMQVTRLVEQADPEGNHNGGWIGFGPDGFLYAAIGDGGGAGDRLRRVRQRPQPGHAARQDAAPRRRRGGDRLRGRRATPSRAAAGSRRSGRSACATPGATRSTARRAISTSRTSARTSGRS